jgi:hypothetical protein
MLTSKQAEFVNGIIKGMNPSEAYRAAGYSADNPATVATEAKRLLENPHISPIIQDARQKALDNAVWSRKVAIERAQVVNDKAYYQLISGEFDRDIYRAWYESTQLLNDLADVEHEKQIRREAFAEECQEVRQEFCEFDFNGEVVKPAKVGYAKLQAYLEMTN